MRRLITMLAGALVLMAIGFSSSYSFAADTPQGNPEHLYLYGKINGTNSTNPSNLSSDAVEMDKISDTEWEKKITNSNNTEGGYGYFKILAIFPDNGTWYAYSAQNNDNDVKIENGNTKDSWFKWDSKTDGKHWYFNNLEGKYIYVKFNSYVDVKVTIKDQSSKAPVSTQPATIWMFGDLGDGTAWSGDARKLVSLTPVSSGSSEYTGTVKFKNGTNYFRFFDGNNEAGPQSATYESPETISIDLPFNVTSNTAGSFKYESDAEGTYDVKLIYNGDRNYTVTISKKQEVTTYDYTVYFVKPSSWSNAYVTFYYGTAASEKFAMTADGGKYKYELKGVTKTPSKVSFSDGTDANKTAEFAFENGKTYKVPEVTDSTELYIYHTENYGTPMLTLTKSTDGVYTATLDESQINSTFTKGKQYYFFISKEKKSGTGWNDFTGIRYTPGSANVDMNANESVSMTLSDANNFMFKNDGTYSKIEITANINDPAKFTFKKTKKGVIDPGPEHIYIFGKLGYAYEDWNTHTNHCTLSKNGEFEDGHTVYTGKIKFAEGQNWFRFWDGSKQIGTSGGNKTVYLNAPIRETGNDVNNASFGYSEGEGEYDVKLVYYGEYDYKFTIIVEDLTPETLYLYDRDNIQQSIALNKVSRGKYRIEYNNPTVDLSKGTYYWFLSEEDKTNANSMADFKNRYTTVAEKDIRLSNNDARTSISQNNANAAMEWHLESRNNAEITKVTITADLLNNLFVISTEVSTSDTKFYLTGDINNWATEDNEFSDHLPPFRFMPATSEELGNAGLSGETGWYTLYVPRMHGQFQIHNGYFGGGNRKFGHIFLSYEGKGNPFTDDKPKSDYVKQTLGESKDAENITLNEYSTGKEVNFLNLHLAHNYYNDAVIYFNPGKQKCFITGTPEDIYIYYYNAWNQGSDVERGTFKVHSEDMNQNTLNYFYDESKLSDNMELHTLTDAEWKVPVVKEKVAAGHQVYRTTVPPGLEEAYKTKSGTHYFQFYLEGTRKLTVNDKYTIDGKSYYFLYNDVLPAVLLSYSVNTGTDQAPVFTEVKIGSEGCPIVKAQYRLILRDNEGKPHYIKADKVSTTDKRSEARIFTLDNIVDQSIFAGQSNHGFNPPEEKSSWHYSKKEATASLMSTNAVDQHWTLSHDANTISSGNASRYIEFDITRLDPDPDAGVEAGTYHEFHSDFNYTDDEYVTDADIDTRAKLGSIKDGAAQNPKFRLNNRDYFTSLNSLMAIPTGVENIVTDNEDANAKPVYYNLQGVRVAHPDKGIYIMVKGKTSKKVRF